VNEADEILAEALIADATAHEAGRFDNLASQYDEVLCELLPIQNLGERRFAIAFNFWNGWCDASNHDWQYYPGITRDDWPRLARHIAERLRTGKAATVQIVIEKFAPENLRSIRVRLWEWIRGLWSRST
jgi:hypothetical protein